MSHTCGSPDGHDNHGPVQTAVPAPPAKVVAPGISITPKAASKLLEILATEKKDPAIVGLRLGVQGGGCSGLSYFMDFDAKKDGDKVFAEAGVQVFVDPRSMLYISGSVLEYAESLMGSGFTVKNPNVKSQCGCGTSFST